MNERRWMRGSDHTLIVMAADDEGGVRMELAGVQRKQFEPLGFRFGEAVDPAVQFARSASALRVIERLDLRHVRYAPLGI